MRHDKSWIDEAPLGWVFAGVLIVLEIIALAWLFTQA